MVVDISWNDAEEDKKEETRPSFVDKKRKHYHGSSEEIGETRHIATTTRAMASRLRVL